MKNLIVLFVVLFSSAFSFAQPSHNAFDTLLKKHVAATGKVNYKNLKADKAALEAYLKMLSENTPVDSWSKNDKFAYWINAYNAATINGCILRERFEVSFESRFISFQIFIIHFTSCSNMLFQ